MLSYLHYWVLWYYFLCVVRSDLYKKLCCLYSNQTLNHLFCLCRIMDLCSFNYGPVAQLGERCPCKAEAPGSNPGGSIIYWIFLIKIDIFIFLCSTFSVVEFVWRNDLFWIVRALVTLLALTNRILVVCYVKIVGRNNVFFVFFSDMFLCLTLEFFFL